MKRDTKLIIFMGFIIVVALLSMLPALPAKAQQSIISCEQAYYNVWNVLQRTTEYCSKKYPAVDSPKKYFAAYITCRSTIKASISKKVFIPDMCVKASGLNVDDPLIEYYLYQIFGNL